MCDAGAFCQPVPGVKVSGNTADPVTHSLEHLVDSPLQPPGGLDPARADARRQRLASPHELSDVLSAQGGG